MFLRAYGDGQADDGGAAHQGHDGDADFVEHHQTAAAKDEQRERAVENADQCLRAVLTVMARAALARALRHDLHDAAAECARQPMKHEYAQGDQQQARPMMQEPMHDVARPEGILEVRDPLFGCLGGLLLGVGIMESSNLCRL